MNTPLNSIAERLSWEVDSRRSTELRVRTEITDHQPPPDQIPDFDSIEEHYVETAEGQRWNDVLFVKSSTPVVHYTHFGDGKKCADLMYDRANPMKQVSAVVKRTYWNEDRGERMERPFPLNPLFVGRLPLAKAIENAVVLEKSTVLGRPCETYLFEHVPWTMTQDHIYSLDEATGIPLKVEAFADGTARQKGNPLWVWTADTFDSVQGHFIPLNSTQVAFSADSTPTMTWNYRVKLANFEEDFPASRFRPVFDPGITVLDTIAKKTYEVPGVKKAVVTQSKSSSSPPLQARQPETWANLFPYASLGFGMILIVVGVGTRWLRRA